MTDPRTYKPGPGFAGDAVEHVRRHHAVMDAHSKRLMRVILQGALDSHDHIVKGLADTPTRAWFEEEFKDDVAAVRDALSLIAEPKDGDHAAEP